MDSHPIILFDGICNLCDRAVQFVIRHDPEAKYKFASLQGETGQLLLKNLGRPLNTLDSFILIDDNKAYTRSDAALLIARDLKGPVKALYGFIIVPRFIRNAVYHFIARNRYRMFGKKTQCMIPDTSIKSRFLN